MNKLLFILGGLFLLNTLACSIDQEKEKNNLQLKSEEKTAIDYSKIKLKVERGAFHYDTFIVDQDSVYFIPKEERETSGEDVKFYKVSSHPIEKEEFKKLVDWILAEGFLKMKSFYEENSSCTSGILVILEMDGKKKKVECTDFHRGCPKLLYQIESKVVKLHGEGLERKFLPG